ncbi:hypothetical protein [Novosphingobium soli]|uniref:Uncharacterized protein n=1 Tax=Novosphingobium soli TaxID=574956 RepID=A0ABV6CSA0_9SPHN
MAQTRRSTTGADQPITRHPLFPAIVALWSAAVFALASIAVSPALLENLVAATGVERVLPMAAPPLGTTTRVLLALAMAALGALAGALVARRIAAGTAPKRLRSAALAVDAGTAQEDEAQASLPRRRRALAMDPTAAQDWSAEAPTADGEPRILNVADFDIEDLDGNAVDDAAFRRALGKASETGADDQPLPPWLDTDAAWRTPDDANGSAPVGGPVFPSEREATGAAPASTPAPTSVEKSGPGFKLLPRLPQGDWSADMPDEAPAPRPFDAPPASDARYGAAPGTAATFDAPAPFAALEAAAQDAARLRDEGRSAAQRIAEARLDDLSPVELVERLALALARRREEARRAAEAAPDLRPGPISPLEFTPPPALAPAPFTAPVVAPVAPDASPGDTVAAARPVPAALRPVTTGLSGAEVEPLPGYQPPRSIGLAAATPPRAALDAIPFPTSPFTAEAGAGQDDEAAVLERGYSSLLDLSRQAGARRAFLTFDHEDGGEDGGEDPALQGPPLDAAPFARPVLAAAPDAAPFDPPAGTVSVPATAAEGPRPFDAPPLPVASETERALREALATLQRVSGAA